MREPISLQQGLLRITGGASQPSVRPRGLLPLQALKRNISAWREGGVREKDDELDHMQSGHTRPLTGTDSLRCLSMQKTATGERTPPGNMLTPGNTERTRCSMLHAVPEGRSNERRGWGGVTSCVVPPPHSLPTKRATFSAKYDRLLTPWGCDGERDFWPVRVADVLQCFVL